MDRPPLPVPPTRPRTWCVTWFSAGRRGKFAAKHDVYLGTTFADVNAAGRTNPKGVLVSQAQDGTTYDSASLLDFGKTYYWRVDEVNAAAFHHDLQGRRLELHGRAVCLSRHEYHGHGVQRPTRHGAGEHRQRLRTRARATSTESIWRQCGWAPVPSRTGFSTSSTKSISSANVGLELQSDHRELRRLRRQGREDRILDRRHDLDRSAGSAPVRPGPRLRHLCS